MSTVEVFKVKAYQGLLFWQHALSQQFKLSKTQKKRLQGKEKHKEDTGKTEKELRVASDGGAYAFAEFIQFFGEEGQWYWDHALRDLEVYCLWSLVCTKSSFS